MIVLTEHEEIALEIAHLKDSINNLRLIMVSLAPDDSIIIRYLRKIALLEQTLDKMKEAYLEI
jgi:hypothetical protein